MLKNFLKKDNRRSHELFFDVMTYLFSMELIKEKNYKVKLKNSDLTQESLKKFLK